MRPRIFPGSRKPPPDDLSELRRLIARPEQDGLRELRERLDDKERRAHDVAKVLPEAVKLSANRSDAQC